jgi:hypothetical protein
MLTILEDGSYLVVAATIPSENDFLRAADVQRGSYSERLVRRIYDHVFGGMVDVKYEYKKYYEKEYSNIMSFLYWKYDIDEQTLTRHEKRIRSEAFLGYAYSTDDGDHNLSYFLSSEVGRKLLVRLVTRATRRRRR